MAKKVNITVVMTTELQVQQVSLALDAEKTRLEESLLFGQFKTLEDQRYTQECHLALKTILDDIDEQDK